MNDLYIAHISHVSWRFTSPFRNDIGRQLMKAPEAAAIGPLLISFPPTHPSPVYGTEFVLRPLWLFYVPIKDGTTLSSWACEPREGLAICRCHSIGSLFGAVVSALDGWWFTPFLWHRVVFSDKSSSTLFLSMHMYKWVLATYILLTFSLTSGNALCNQPCLTLPSNKC